MLVVEPTTLRHANGFVERYHRHHKPARGCVFCVSVVTGERVRGVAIFGRPKSQMLQDGVTGEITRVCTDGYPNACSKLYGLVAKTARALGYERILTYTLPEEGGAVSERQAGCSTKGRSAVVRGHANVGHGKMLTHSMPNLAGGHRNREGWPRDY